MVLVLGNVITQYIIMVVWKPTTSSLLSTCFALQRSAKSCPTLLHAVEQLGFSSVGWEGGREGGKEGGREGGKEGGGGREGKREGEGEGERERGR